MAPSPIHTRPVLIEINGRLDIERLQCSLNAIIVRHDPLRSRIRWHRGSPCAHLIDHYASQLTHKSPPHALLWQKNEALGDVVEKSTSKFNLESEPPVRLYLYQLEPRKHLLLLTHDTAFDGLSESILTREPIDRYQSDHVSEKYSQPLCYRDYARQQHEEKIDGSLGIDIDYWSERLRALPDGSPITTDCTPSGQPSHEAATIRSRLPPYLIQPLESIARGSGATLFMILLAAFIVLLHRFGGHSDFVIGVPTSGRTLPGTENLIGRFVYPETRRVSQGNGRGC